MSEDALTVIDAYEADPAIKVVIMRGTERLKFSYADVIKGKKLEQNIYLQDGDHIYVP